MLLIQSLPRSNIMSTEVLCSKPQTPHKRALADIDFEALPLSKYARRSPPLVSTPPIHDQHSESSHWSLSSLRSTLQCLEDPDPRSVPPKKGRRLQSPRFEVTDDQHLQITRLCSALPWPTCASRSKHDRPQFPIDSSVEAWISAVFSSDSSPISPSSDRPSTCPAIVNVDKAKCSPSSLAAIKQMSQQSSQCEDSVGFGSGTSQSGRPGTSHPLYRGTLYNNYVTLNYSRRQMSEELRTFATLCHHYQEC